MLDQPLGLLVREILTRDEDVLVESHSCVLFRRASKCGCELPDPAYERRRVRSVLREGAAYTCAGRPMQGRAGFSQSGGPQAPDDDYHPDWKTYAYHSTRVAAD